MDVRYANTYIEENAFDLFLQSLSGGRHDGHGTLPLHLPLKLVCTRVTSTATLTLRAALPSVCPTPTDPTLTLSDPLPAVT